MRMKTKCFPLVLILLAACLFSNDVCGLVNSQSSALNIQNGKPDDFTNGSASSVSQMLPESNLTSEVDGLLDRHTKSLRNGTTKPAIHQSTNAVLLFPYRTYRDVQILHFSVPELTYLATWQLTSNTTSSSKCENKKIHFYLRFGAYPVVAMDNSSFPSDMFLDKNYYSSVAFESNKAPAYLNVSSPTPGDWFGIAFIEEDTDKIVQKGLFTVCQAWLHTHVKHYTEETVITLIPGVPFSNEVIATDRVYRFYTTQSIWSAEISISKCSIEIHSSDSNQEQSQLGCPIVLYSRPFALPVGSQNESSVNCSFEGEFTGCRLEVVAVENGWNYVLIQKLSFLEVHLEIIVNTAACQENVDDAVEVADVPQISSSKMPQFLKPKFKRQRSVEDGKNESVVPNSNDDGEFNAITIEPLYAPSVKSCWPRIHLIRNDLPGNFAFRFDQLPDGNDSTPVLVNFSINAISLLKFELAPILDVGGTLALEVVFPKSINTTEKNVSVSVCLEHLVRPALSILNGSCLSSTSISVNTSSFRSRFGTLLLPFPQSGLWYISLSANCYVQPDNSSSDDPTYVPCDDNHTSVFLQVKSSPCVQGQCGAYGNCYQYISGNVIYSTCVCAAGWRGWGCTDNSKATSNSLLISSVLLLTLSNVLFLPAIILAIRRRYFTEAVVYLTTMFFSTMYHACDSEVFYYCMLKLNVLQFCDFYSAILSVWVTLIAMAQIPLSYPYQSLAHMMGAIGVAIGVEYDRTGLWVFLIPSTLGVFVMLITWVSHCRKIRQCYPRWKIWLFGLLPGVLIVGTGLILYTQLETRSNYQYVHSGWHACMAIAILFLLPERRKAERKGYVQWEENGNVNCSSYVRVEALCEVLPPALEDTNQHSDQQLIPETNSNII